ncbi:tape measure protein [Sphingomonas hengshuiensis]|uniref:tape measure protein n=1 Tax=Sphingomonas hengshuiensis TaxID=1609977 RepID=UPI0006972872|nr:tape measure protein [Sphingomonas hengshuiensis]
MKLSLILEAIDRATAPARRVTAAVEGLTRRGIKPLGKAMQDVDRAGSRFLTGLPTRITALAARVRALAGRAGMGALTKAAEGTGFAIGRLIRMAGGLAAKGLALGTAGAGFLGGWFTSGVIGQASKFEQFRVVLENTEGSAAAAKRAMDWVKQFATVTPYELGDVMEAFVALKAYGIDPTDGALRTLGDAASGMGKPLMQAIEMMADAQTGEFERLKEFGIRSKVQGNQVAFTYQRNGKEITRTAQKSGVAIQKALMGIFGERFGGMMDKQSRTFAGMWSNLSDALTNFQVSIADAGFFDAVKGKLEAMLSRVNALAADGTLAKWAQTISDRMTAIADKAVQFATGTDWAAVGNGLVGIANALLAIVGALGKAYSYASNISAIAARNQAKNGLNGWFVSDLRKAELREQLRSANRRLGMNPNDGIPADQLEKERRALDVTVPGVAPRKPFVPTEAPAWGKPGAFRPLAPPRALVPSSARPAAPAKPAEGKISLHVTTDRGVTATPTQVSARGMKVEVNTGRAMSGVA